MNIGHNTESGQLLGSFVERIESIRANKKQLTDDEAMVKAEAKAQGFIPAALTHVIKLRAMKPHARQEAEAIVDTYLHALGMASDTPLFRHVGTMDVDRTSREQVIEALKKFVPENGSIIIEAGGRPVRLTRDKTGDVTAVEVVDRPAPATAAASSTGVQRAEPPSVDGAGAEALGRQAFTDNSPIITNPFPFGDVRRPRWDAGWRQASGTDGMGPGA